MQNKDSSIKVVVNGQNKRTKRRKESSESQHNEKAKKCCKKSKKSKEKNEDSRRTCSAPQMVPEPAPSDSEEDYSLCAAPWCREPEGDEVCCCCVFSMTHKLNVGFYLTQTCILEPHSLHSYESLSFAASNILKQSPVMSGTLQV